MAQLAAIDLHACVCAYYKRFKAKPRPRTRRVFWRVAVHIAVGI